MNFFRNLFRRSQEPAPAPKRRGLFSTHRHPLGDKVEARFEMPAFEQPSGAPTVASDNGYIGERPTPKTASFTPVNEAQLGFYAAGSIFIGYQACAMLATNWLIDKACNMPARDAVRNG